MLPFRFVTAKNQLQPQPQPQPLLPPQNKLFSVPFFHMLYKRAMRMGVQLPARTPSSPLPLQPDAISNKMSIHRQLLQPPILKRFIDFLL